MPVLLRLHRVMRLILLYFAKVMYFAGYATLPGHKNAVVYELISL